MRRDMVILGVVAVSAALVGILVGRTHVQPDTSVRFAEVETTLTEIVSRLNAPSSHLDLDRAPISPATDASSLHASLGAVIDRLDALEAKVATEAGLQSNPVEDRAETARASAAELIVSGEATLATVSSPKSILSSFAAETAVSRWGEAASETIMQAYMTEFARGDFFMNYGGSVSADCRETVCRIDLKLDQSVSQLDGYERAEVVQFGEFELMGLAGRVDGIGTVTTSVQGDPDRPTITLYFDSSGFQSQANDITDGLSGMSR